MSNIAYIDKDLKTVWVICDECKHLKGKYWVKTTLNALRKNGYVICPNGHRTEILNIRFLPKNLHPS